MADLLQFPLFPPEQDDAPAAIETTETPAAEEHLIPPASLPPDHAARQRALDTRVSCIVEAPAGSGKTGLLLQRFLKLLAEGGVQQPEEVLAITFTRKATAELRERVLEQLQHADSGHELPASAGSFERETRALADAVLALDARLGWGLLDNPQRLRIRTIDSVCAEIARTLPLLSGSGVTQPVDDANPLYREAARRTLLQLGGDNPALNDALRTVLLHRDGSIEDCTKLLARMLAERQQWGELVPLRADALADQHLDSEVRPRLERSLESIVCAALTRALNAMPAGVLEELTALAARLGFEPSHEPGKPSPIAICAGRQTSPEARADDLEHWVALLHLLFTKDGDWRKTFPKNSIGFEISTPDAATLRRLIQGMQTDRLREILCAVRDLPPARYPDEQWRVAKALFHLLRRALAELKVLFAETAHCDFAELAIAATEALASDSGATDLSASPDARLTHLLVDEMQDTSSSQYRLIELLTRSWDGRSQTLFLVGDPKQSIYLFRQARVERFLRTVRERRLGEVPLQPLQLTANFRSQGALVEAFNGTFARIFPATAAPAQHPGEELEVPFVHADPVREPTPETSAIRWHTHVLGDEFVPGTAPNDAELKIAHRRAEARDIRRIIEQWRARPLPPGRSRPWRIAVLARARQHLDPIVAELSGATGQAPIPYRAVRVDALNERPEVLDALALTRALLHPADRAAWLAVLRAPWCGLPLADLLRLTGEGPAADREATVAELVTARRDQLSREGRQPLDRTWPVLSEALATLGRTSFAMHVERTWRSLGGDAPLTPERLANVRCFLHVLRELELAGAGRIDLTLLDARLAELYAEPAALDDAVELLTIHTSKGLEFDLVLVPSLERKASHSESQLLNWLELDPSDTHASHILLAPIWQRGDDSDPLNRWLTHVRNQRERAEIRRLFYVACTRAREELHLFGACERKVNGEIRKPEKDTLLHAAWPSIADAFQGTQAPQAWPAAATGHTTATVHPFPAPSLAEAIPGDGFAIAAAAVPSEPEPAVVPLVLRLPAGFDPLARFTSPGRPRLPYTPASALPHARSFERPEGSFSVRAFGNVVHRFLQLLSQRLERTNDPAALLAELDTWEPRLRAALRSEGLASSAAVQGAARALTALRNTLSDPVGRWILSPHAGAANERSVATLSGVLRADRTFLAGTAPLATGDRRLWIVDFKTTEQGSRSRDFFDQEELLKYRPQLERYASVLRRTSDGDGYIELALYYPLIPHIIHWTVATDAIP